MSMNKEHIVPLACGIISLACGVTGHGIAAGVFGLAGVILALPWGRE